MFTNTTGSKQVLVRYGFSDYDTYGGGNYACAATGNLDAPKFIPQGSVRACGSAKGQPELSHGHRDWNTGHMEPGDGHDGK